MKKKASSQGEGEGVRTPCTLHLDLPLVFTKAITFALKKIRRM